MPVPAPGTGPVPRPRIAVVGGGIAGLAAARALSPHVEVALFEAGEHFGGHAHTVDVTLDGVTHGVDTGFLVFNERTYPGFCALLRGLGVPVAPSDMSFSVQAAGAFGAAALEWCGSDLGAVFCQPANAIRPRFWRMLRDLLRFNSLGTLLAQAEDATGTLDMPVSAFLQRHGFSREFRDWYLLPMVACIWSCPAEQMLRFPMATLLRFCHNHGLLQMLARPQWYTIPGGSQAYVRKLVGSLRETHLCTPVRRVRRDADGVTLFTDVQALRFDAVVMAVHSDQALRMLDDPSAEEREVLGAIRYQPNLAALHTDAGVLPRRRRAWAAWNHEAGPGAREVCLHYLINKLQPLPWRQPVLVSLNPLRPIARQAVLGEFQYEHPVFDLPAIRAQAQLPALQGRRHTWYCGAWTGYGFHEDGLQSGQQAAGALVARLRIDRAARAREEAVA